MIVILTFVVVAVGIGVLSYGVWARVHRERNIRNLIRRRYGPNGTH
jgi:hypothetical protein